MARDPYTVLGVSRDADEAAVRSAFRKLAKELHPDRNPGDKRAEERFKEANAAFDILGDAEKRKRFDRGEIDADGRERAPQFREWRSGAGPGGAAGGGAAFEDIGDIFSDLFGGRRSQAARGRDVRYRLEVDFLDAANGAVKRVTMPDGRTLEIAIPTGLSDGQTLRLRGQGEPGRGGGPSGDVYVEVSVTPHPYFERDGADIRLEAPITLKEAVLGAKITVPTISGNVAVKVPPNASSGALLRLRGKGVPSAKGGPAGDQLIRLKIVLPERGDAALRKFAEGWDAGPDPRARAFRG